MRLLAKLPIERIKFVKPISIHPKTKQVGLVLILFDFIPRELFEGKKQLVGGEVSQLHYLTQR